MNKEAEVCEFCKMKLHGMKLKKDHICTCGEKQNKARKKEH